ncbi:MAG TPA: nucleoside triphosphate pyrophosphohydrolase [Candidatus Butyricicoccus avistercoris]|uniref:Nucleoside triphosphate pyrophosphohydrolase n=1 Tax=Candidatus Butyricicoccus avistercoris TaxID=2838518 RepID=A0A9D1TI96_9FIRM|nr:nucleoside triphosphate pyrophosphohydrolase [Candidatus Butyricicoccus avistercoris]
MIDFKEKENYTFDDLVEIVRILRAPNGCMWDREQTHESIRRNFIEETYEVIEAIDTKDTELLKEELGDVLLQVVFHACIEQENNVFDINDVADGVCKKLIYRHPHVFAKTDVNSTEEILTNWDALKQKEKNQKTVTDSLKSVARSLPSLIRAEKIQKKAAKAGFDWQNVNQAIDKVREELDEIQNANENTINEEVGDMLFAAVNVARILKVEPEQALEKASDKFIVRFERVEKTEKNLADLSFDELLSLWKQAKECKND